MSQLIRRKEITIIIMIFCAFFVLGDRVVSIPFIKNMSKSIQEWAVAIASGTMVVAFVTTIVNNIQRIRSSLERKRSTISEKEQYDWFFSLVTIVSSLGTVIIGLIWGVKHPSYQWIYQYILQNLATAIASFLALFYITAAFRAFRARTMEAAILLFTSIFVMLTTNPFGEALWRGFPVLGNFFMNWLQLGAKRGIDIVTGIGTAAICIRVLLGHERGVAAEGGE